MTSATIYDRIDAAYKDIAAEKYAKTGKVSAGNTSYNFIPIGQMLAVVRKAHAAHGIKVLFGAPEYDHDRHESRREITSTNRYGDSTTWYVAVGHMSVRIIGGSEDDVIETSVGFEAKDNSDKLTNKVYTNAERTLYRTLYAIDEGSPDPEAENVPNGREEAPAEKIRTKDKFFGGNTAISSPKEKVETSILSAALDRPMETKVGMVRKASADPQYRKTVLALISANGPIDTWTDDQVDEAVLAIKGASD